ACAVPCSARGAARGARHSRRRRVGLNQSREWNMGDREVGLAGKPRRWLAVAVLGLCGFATGPAAAQWAVVDVPHTVKTALGWVAQYQQMIEDYERQVEQLQSLDRQYEQALVTGDAYAGDSGHRENF